MMRSWILLALGASACAEPVIELSFKLPTKGDCAAAKAIDGPNAGADIGTLMPSAAGGVLVMLR